jgi:uncharacterized protein YkwD
MNQKAKNMKNLFLLLILVPSFLLGQTSLETAVFNEFNNYRKSKGLTPLPYDSKSSSASRQHSKWMSLAKEISHYQEIDVPNFQELVTLKDRNKSYGVNMFSEIVTSCASVNFVGSPLSDEVIAKQIIENFANSPDHEGVMRMIIKPGDSVKIGVGLIKSNGISYATINFTEL